MGAAESRIKVTTAGVWQQARELHPAGTRLVRVIDLDGDMQIFQPIAETELNFMDGATIVRPSVPGGRPVEDLDEIIAGYDAKFLGVTA